MFAKPTINDFLALIDRDLERIAGRARQAVEQVENNASRTGRTGGTVDQIFEAVRTQFDAGIRTTLGHLGRVLKETSLDRTELRQLAVQRLMQFAITAKSLTKPDQLRRFAGTQGLAQYVDEQLAAFDRDLQFEVRQFDVGFNIPDEGTIPRVLQDEEREAYRPSPRPDYVTPPSNTIPAPVSIVPTVYPADPSNKITVENHITININGAEFREFNASMKELLGELRHSNTIAGEVREKLAGEMEAGTTILATPKADPKIIDILLVRPLKYIAEKSAGSIINKLALAALEALGRLTGLF
jgi:hypothetical protein